MVARVGSMKVLYFLRDRVSVVDEYKGLEMVFILNLWLMDFPLTLFF